MRVLLLGLGLVVASHAAQAADTLVTVDELLQRASKALQEEDYRGRFTYEFGNALETLEVVHVVQEGKEYERIRHLNGTEREFIRAGRDRDCVTVGNFLLRGGLISSEADAVSLAQNYHFYIRGNDRVANRDAQVVQAIPKDEFRYGMTLAVDKESGLPLMSIITSGPQHALERFQFVHPEVDPQISEKDLQPEIPGAKHFDGASVNCAKEEFAYDSPWRPSWLPPGFLLTHASTNEQDGDALTYTDGIASFSLFIKAAKDGAAAVPQGMAKRGATVALLSVLQAQQQTYNVVLVGEVPSNTAQRVVASLEHKSQVK